MPEVFVINKRQVFVCIELTVSTSLDASCATEGTSPRSSNNSLSLSRGSGAIMS